MNSEDRFCCSGCKYVYSFIQDHGLGQYYEIKTQQDLICPLPVPSVHRDYHSFDLPDFIKDHSPDGAQLTFYIEGIQCTACLWLLERLHQVCPSVQSSRLNMASATLEVVKKKDGFFSEIARTVHQMGYRPHPLKENSDSSVLQKMELRKDLSRIGLAAACTGNIMILAVSVYGGATGDLARQFEFLSGLLAFPVLTYSAWPFYRSAWGGLRHFRLNIDVPIVAALIAGVLASGWNLIYGREGVYFDSLSMLVFLLLSSRTFLKSVQMKHLKQNHLSEGFLYSKAEIMNSENKWRLISAMEIKPGDLLRVNSSDTLPVDGVVISGIGYVQRSILTGESEPVKIQSGDLVQAGSQNLGGEWTYRATSKSSESRIFKILEEASRVAGEKSEYAVFADKIAQYFVGIVFVLAGGLLAFFLSTDPLEGFERALALIIVTCPCVFGLAIPLSLSLSLKKAAQKGILIKDGQVIESLWKAKTFLFDKTGTLTRGQFEIVSSNYKDNEVLALAAGLEKDQMHPVAQSLRNFAASKKIQAAQVHDVHPLPQGGIEGLYGERRIRIVPCSLEKPTSDEKDVFSSFEIWEEGERLGQFLVGDRIRQESREVLEELKASNKEVAIVSGDRKSAVMSVAQNLGLSSDKIFFELTPEDKIKKARAPGTVMIGDGANDAGALAAADVGVALSGSLDMSIKAAKVYLMKSDLRMIPELLKIAQKTRNTILRNLLFSVSFNVLAGYLALSGQMTPLLAAVLMPLSSLVVLLSSLSTFKWSENQLGGDR